MSHFYGLYLFQPSVGQARTVKLRKKRKVKHACDQQCNQTDDGLSNDPQSSSDSSLEFEQSAHVLGPQGEAVSVNETEVLDAESSDDCQEDTAFNSEKAESEPLCKCTNTTVGDVMFMTLSIGLRHGLSWDAQVDILKMWKAVFGGTTIPLSKQTYLKKLNAVKDSDIEYHGYCKVCDVYMGKRDAHERFCKECDQVYRNDENEEYLENCVECFTPLEERTVKVDVMPCKTESCSALINFNDAENVFVSVSIESQLQKFVKDDRFVNSIMQYRFNRQYIPGVYKDIYDGQMYQKYFANNGVLSSPYNFSYTFFTDGIAYSKSGGKTVWPIYLTINELPYEERSKYFILAAVYCGIKEPKQQWLFEPFVKQANILSGKGFNWIHKGKSVTSVVIPLCLVADSGARSKLVNMQSFSATYGCTFCYHQSVKIGAMRFLIDITKEPAPLRTAAGYADDLKGVMEKRFEVQEKNRSCRGVKGPCVLSNLHYFSILDNCVVDYMHCVLIGCVKTHMEFILEPINKKYWNNMKINDKMENLIASIDKSIKEIQSTTSVIRNLGLLKNMATWKASEYRSWLLFYCIVCLKGFLKEKHVEHLALLSKGANLLLQKTVSHNDIVTALKLFKMYSVQCQEIWGERHMTYNIHLLGHIPRCILLFGPMWGHNSFSYESKNRHILQLCRSPHHLPYQVARKFLIYQALPTVCSKLVQSKMVTAFHDKLLNYKLLVNYDRVSEMNCVLLGKPVILTITDQDLEKLDPDLRNCGSRECLVYERMYYKKKKYTTSSYGDGKKNNDSYAMLDCGQCVNILRIVKHPAGNKVLLYVEKVNTLVKPVLEISIGKFDQIKRIVNSGERVIVSVERLDKPCFRLKVRSKQFISQIPYGCTVE